jgi:hypothetical protein
MRKMTMNTSLAKLALVSLLFSAGTGCQVQAADFASQDTLQNLNGTWASSSPEDWYGGKGTREFTFKDKTWELKFTHALDPAMTVKTFMFRTEGPYVVGAKNDKVDGAYNGTFYEKKKYVTLLTEDPKIIQAFGFSDCKLQYNVEVDVSSTGCAAWRPVEVCGEDHDLFAMDDKGVYFGVRPADNDMCAPEKRPTALLQPVVKQ